MENIKNNLETLVPKIQNVAHTKGVHKMEALVNACVEEDELDEEAKLSDGKNNDLLYSLVLYFMKILSDIACINSTSV